MTPEIHSDRPWWIDKLNQEPNISRLQAAICRRELVADKDKIIKVDVQKSDSPSVS